MFHERSKHIVVRLHFIRDEVESGRVRVVKIDTAHNPANLLTNPLSKEKFDYCCRLVNLHAMHVSMAVMAKVEIVGVCGHAQL